MSKGLSVAEILAKLEARIAEHKERRDFHAQQEALHRERHAFHDAELEKVLRRHEANRAVKMLRVVPVHESFYPLTCAIHISEWTVWIIRPILERFEKRF